MEGLIGLLIMLIGVSCETTCDGRQTGTLCYGILGESVYIHLTDDATEVNEYTLIKRVSGNPEVVQTLKSKEVKPAGSRFKFLSNNGTLIIRGVTKNDSAEYKFNSYKDGKAITTLILHFKVKGRYYWVIGVSAVAMTLVVVVIVGKFYLQKKRLRQPNSVAALESPELTYVEVSIQRTRPGTPQVMRCPPGPGLEEVEYGQIKVLGAPTQTRARPEKQEETIYAGVQVGQ